jgi:hypothetical protein
MAELANASVKMSDDPFGSAVEATRHGFVEARNLGNFIRRDRLNCRLWKNLIGRGVGSGSRSGSTTSTGGLLAQLQKIRRRNCAVQTGLA